MAFQLYRDCEPPIPGFRIYGFFQKPSNNFTGTYYYSGIKNWNKTISTFNATIESKLRVIELIRVILDCNRTNSYNINGTITSNCNKTVDDIVAEIVNASSIYECGDKCSHTVCPYNRTVS
jgi:hypothetical protein